MVRFKSKFMLFSLLATVVLFACGDPIPVKEMSNARHAISKAYSVKADKYSPALVQEASDLLIQSHSYIQEDKFDEATNSAKLSEEKANKAYEESLPLLAKDTVEVAEKSLQDAEVAYASELAQAEYKVASDKLQKSREFFDSKNYYDAYLTAIEADSDAKVARNSALAKKDMLKDAVVEVNAVLAEAAKYNSNLYAAEKVKSSEENIAIANADYDSLALKEGFAAAAVAKAMADDALLDSLKGTATKGIDDAQAAIDEIEKSSDASVAMDETAGAKELLSTAKNQFEETQYVESINSSNEAKRLAAIAMSAITAAAAQKAADEEAAKVSASAGKTTPAAGTVAAKDKGVASDVAAAGSEDYDLYTVKYKKHPPKDCLWIIAKNFYKKPFWWKKIFNANTDKIKNPNLIYPGQELRVPKIVKEVKAPEAKKEEPKAEVKEEAKEEPAPQAAPEIVIPESYDTDADAKPEISPEYGDESAPVVPAPSEEPKSETPAPAPEGDGAETSVTE